MRIILIFLLSFLFFFPSFPISQISQIQEEIIEARNKVMPALVHIEPVKSYYTTGERRHTVVTGSGFIFSDQGHILTNHHVVENAERVECTLSGKAKISARVLGSDPSTDVAVLQLNPDELKEQQISYTRLGNSDQLEVGQIVLALGSPLGLSRSVSMGVISSIDRYFENNGQSDSPYNLWIQTDAAINPGNSGGPLINLAGEVIGINSRGVFLAENLGFAIPINLAKEIAEQLISGDKISRSWIGLQFQTIKDFREYQGEPDLKGILIGSIDILSPAEKAGLLPGDVLISIDQTELNAEYEEDLPKIRKFIADLPQNKKINLKVWRDGRVFSKEIITESEPFQFIPEFECQQWGFVVKGLNRIIFQFHSLPDYNGVYISAVKNGEIAEENGLRNGDVIRKVNNIEITDFEQYRKIYESLVQDKPETVFLEVLRRGAPYYAVLKFE